MVKKFVWDDKYSVNVPSLDEQHKKFFEMTNRIIDLLEKPHNPELKKDLILLLAELGEYALRHLNYEEECIKDYKCTGCENHPSFHDVYREKVKEYLERSRDVDTNIYELSNEVAEFTQTWLSSHILKRDRDYIPCMTERGAQ